MKGVEVGKYIILIGDWIGRVEADSNQKAKIEGIRKYREETKSSLRTTDLLPYTYPRRVKDRDTSIIKVLEERLRS